MKGKLFSSLLALGVALGLCLSPALAWAEEGETPVEQEVSSSVQEDEPADEDIELTAQETESVDIIEFTYEEPCAGVVAPSVVSVSSTPPLAATGTVPVRWLVVSFMNGAGAPVGELQQGDKFEAGYAYYALADTPQVMSIYAIDAETHVYYNNKPCGNAVVDGETGAITMPTSRGFGPLVDNPSTLVSSFDLAVDEPAAGATPDTTATVTFTCANGTTVTGTDELAVTWQEFDGPSTTSNFHAMGENDTFQEGKYYLVHTVREDGAFSVLPDGYYYNLMDSSSYEWSVNGRLRSNGDVPSNYIGPLGQEVLYPYTLTYNYDEDSHTATVIGLTSDSSIEGDLVIPETVRHEGATYTVTAIGQKAFTGMTGFTGTLTLPDTVESIDTRAFYGCSKLTGALKLPANLKSIGSEAFYDCNGFTGSWSFPEGLKTIGDYAFLDCCNIGGTIILPASVKSIGNYSFYMSNGHYSGWKGVGGLAFADGSQLESIGAHAFDGNWYFKGGLNFPDSLTEIGDYAFKSTSVGNDNHEEGTLTLPSNIKTIGEGAFQYCGFSGGLVIPASMGAEDASLGAKAFNQAGFTGQLILPDGLRKVPDSCFLNSDFTGTLTLPSTLVEVGVQSFGGLGKLEGDLVIPASLTSIKEGAFYGFGGTGALVLPDTLTKIEPSVFNGVKCTGALNIPDSVESIGNHAFNECTGFISLKLPNNPKFTTIESNTFGTTWYGFSNYVPVGFTGELVIPDSVTSIGDYAFRSCVNFTGTLKLPRGVTSIGREAFHNCTGFTGVELPESLTTIGYEAFCNCKGLAGSLTIPANVKTIGEGAFENCTGLNGALTLPNGLETLDREAFAGCTSLTGVADIPNSVTTLGIEVFEQCEKLTGYSLPTGITSIPSGLFNGCSGMTGPLSIPDTVTRIDNRAFCDCSGLTGDLTIPDSVTTIGSYAFSDCSGLNGTLSLPSGLAKIESGAFKGCSGLTGTLTLPTQLTSISYSAFEGCSSLTGRLTIPSSVTSLSSDVFKGCSGFTSLDLSQMKCGDLASSLFSGCTGLTGDITLPATIRRISYGVFYGCTGLTGTLTIPASVTEGSYYALEGSHFATIVNNGSYKFSGDIAADDSYYYVDVTGQKADTIAAGTYTRKANSGDTGSVAINLSTATVTVTNVTYTGAALKPAPTVKVGTATLRAGTDYTVAYKNNINVGTATVTLTGKGGYTGTKSATFKIAQAANSATAKKMAVKKTVKADVVAKKAQKVALPKVTAKFGKAVWKVTSKDKKKVLSLKAGKVVVKKGAKRGTYTIKLKAKVAGTANYKAASTKTVTVKVVVK